MGAIAGAILLMTGLIGFGAHSKSVGLKRDVIILLVTLAELTVFIWFMYTYEPPVL